MSEQEEKTSVTTFLQFISGLAVQTLVHLGKMSNPMTNRIGVDLPNAKYSIDILAVMEEKTKGNLTPQENEYLQNALRDLRLEYVSVTNSLVKPPAEKAEKKTDPKAGETTSS